MFAIGENIKNSKYLPIGSVVLLKETTKKLWL